jgi:putative transposase
MARLARSTIIGYPHQVTQRGNYGQRVFEEDADFVRYLAWAREYASRYSIDIWAYCLMPNHVHFVCVPKTTGALALGFNTLNMRYAQYFHKKKGVSGHLWKGRFLSCILDNLSVYEEVRFIENNPVRAGIAKRSEEYPWSSARSHVTGVFDPVLSDGHCFLASEIPDWLGYLASGGNQDVITRVRARLKTGRPAGDSEFVHRLEAIVGRRLEALPRGRPRKADYNSIKILTSTRDPK